MVQIPKKKAVRRFGDPKIQDYEKFPDEPICNIAWLAVDTLRANDWNPNAVMSAEMKLLERSILAQGWVQPILINTGRIIIDGYHRSILAGRARLRAVYGGLAPCVVLDITDAEAMLLTVRINRAKGSHVAFRMSALVHRLIDDYGLTPAYISQSIGAPLAEIDLLYQDGVFEARVPAGYTYSQAWVPEESRAIDRSREAAV